MKENKILRIYMNGIFTVKDVNEELEAGWTVQTAIPVGNGAVDYVLVRETSDKKEDNAERIRKQLNAVLEELDKVSDNKWWAKVSYYFKVSKFPEIFETYDAGEAIEIIQKFYTEEDETNDKEQSSENQS